MSEEEKELQEEPSEQTGGAENSTRFLVIAIVFIVFLTVMFFSIKYFYHPEQKTEKYTTPTGQEFEYLAGLWNTQWQRGDSVYNLHFHYNPGQTENVSVIGQFDSTSFNKGYVYITFDPEGEDLSYVRLAMMELSLNLYGALNVQPIAACTKNATACANVSILNCNSTTEPLIQLNSKEGTFIGLSDNCIYIQGDGNELVRASDRLLFQWFRFL